MVWKHVRHAQDEMTLRPNDVGERARDASTILDVLEQIAAEHRPERFRLHPCNERLVSNIADEIDAVSSLHVGVAHQLPAQPSGREEVGVDPGLHPGPEIERLASDV